MIGVSSDEKVFHLRVRDWSSIVLLAIGVFCIVLPQSDFFRAMPGDMGDTRFNELILEHVFRWLRGVDHDLWSPGFFFPFPGALAFSDNHFGSVGAYALLRLAGWTTEGAYIGWFTLAYAVNFVCCAHALRRFGLTPLGSAVGAFLFAFGMPVLAQTGHAQLGYRFAIPLAMLALHRFVHDGRARYVGWLAIWTTVQLLCSIYLGYFLLLLIGSWLFAAHLTRATARSQVCPLGIRVNAWDTREGLYVGTALAICAATLAIAFLPYLHFARLYGFARLPAEIANLLPRPGSYLLADLSRVWGTLSHRITGIPMRDEQQLFIGIGGCALAAIGLMNGQARWMRTAAIALLLLVALTLAIDGWSAYRVLESLPLANAIRGVSRIILVMLFPLALLVGAGIDWLCADRPRWRAMHAIAAALLTLLLIVECAARYAPNVPLHDWRARRSAVLRGLPDTLSRDAILFVPHQAGVPDYLTELDGMDLAQRLGGTTINGYSGNNPPGFGSNTAPCDDLINRLVGYVDFVRGDTAQLAALAKRVLIVGAPLHCDVPTLLPPRSHFSGRLPDDAYGRVRVRVENIALAPAHQLDLEVVVSNHTNAVLATISDSHEPIRISWRFIATNASRSNTRGWRSWDTRGDLQQDVPAQGESITRLRIAAPVSPGIYHLEFSLVQEGVAWFHDRGMPIARSTQSVQVNAAGHVSISH